MSTSAPPPIELLGDRIKFKEYATDRKFNELKNIFPSQSPIDFETRVKCEIAIECLLAHLIGIRDAILTRINKKLQLGIVLREISVNRVYDELDKTGRGNLIKNLKGLQDRNNPIDWWLLDLIDLRNAGTHNNILNLEHAVNLTENVNTGANQSGPMRIYFKGLHDTSLDVIPYLEDRISRMKNLINDIIKNEPLLSSD